MSDRERAMQLINNIPDNKLVFIINMLENINHLLTEEESGTVSSEDIPNDETLAAIKELEEGGGECFNTLEELWKNLEE